MINSIYEAIEKESIEDVKNFLTADKDFIEEGNWNPLHAASRKGNIAIIEAILQHAANDPFRSFDVNAEFEIMDDGSDIRGTALTEALLNGNKDAAKLLIKSGASVKASYYSRNEDTPEWLSGNYELSTNGGVAWWLAADDEELLKLCIKNGIDIDATDCDDTAALAYAIAGSKQGKVARLLSLGANPDAYVNHEHMGRIPLLVYAVQICCEQNTDESFRIVELLLKHGATLSSACADCENESAIDIIMSFRNERLSFLFGLQNILERIPNQ